MAPAYAGSSPAPIRIRGGHPQNVVEGFRASETRDIVNVEGDNGGVFVSTDVVTMLASLVTILVALFGGFAWMIRRMDAGFAAQDARFEARFAAQDARFDRVDDRLGRVEQELTEVKIAIARLEGPTPRLLT